MFAIVAEKFLENLPVVNSTSTVFGKRQSSDIIQRFTCKLKSQWSDLEFLRIMVG